MAFQARLLAAGLGIGDVEVREAIPRAVIDLARDGQQIKAIKELRKHRKLRLIEAKRVVDEIVRAAGDA